MARHRGKPKPRLRDLSKKTLSEEEIDELLAALNKPRQPPLLTAIYGAKSIVEYEVEQLIRSRIEQRRCNMGITYKRSWAAQHLSRKDFNRVCAPGIRQICTQKP